MSSEIAPRGSVDKAGSRPAGHLTPSMKYRCLRQHTTRAYGRAQQPHALSHGQLDTPHVIICTHTPRTRHGSSANRETRTRQAHKGGEQYQQLDHLHHILSSLPPDQTSPSSRSLRSRSSFKSELIPLSTAQKKNKSRKMS